MQPYCAICYLKASDASPLSILTLADIEQVLERQCYKISIRDMELIRFAIASPVPSQYIDNNISLLIVVPYRFICIL